MTDKHVGTGVSDEHVAVVDGLFAVHRSSGMSTLVLAASQPEAKIKYNKFAREHPDYKWEEVDLSAVYPVAALH